jgi:transcriptional regulator with XRE-family HTH domain
MAKRSRGKGRGTPPREPTAASLEFGRRLQRAMIAKNWSQSELARRANAMLPPPAPGQIQGKEFRRDLVSHYVRGQHMPSPASLAAMARALGVTPADLMPQEGIIGGDPSPFAMQTLSDGRVSLHVNRTVSSETAMKVAALLLQEDK